MDNAGKLLEAWVVTCSKCERELVLHWNNGTHMSKSQATRLLTNEETHNWKEVKDGWICPDCIDD